jgi:hypothetical protein
LRENGKGYRIFMRKPSGKNHSEDISMDVKIILKGISKIGAWKIVDSYLFGSG